MDVPAAASSVRPGASAQPTVLCADAAGDAPSATVRDPQDAPDWSVAADLSDVSGEQPS